MNPMKMPKATPTLFWALKNDIGMIMYLKTGAIIVLKHIMAELCRARHDKKIKFHSIFNTIKIQL